jgi:hypothetical protein
MRNSKGFAIVVVPLTIVILGLIGTGALATIEHEKTLVKQRDQQRKIDIQFVQQELVKYYSVNQNYPLQRNESVDGWEVLKQHIDNLPNDPLIGKGWHYNYWSDSKGYTLRYLLEENSEEQVVFGY